MLELSIPGRGQITLHHLVCDVSGTLTTDGALIDGVSPRLAALVASLQVHLVTADTHGRQAEIDRQLGLTASRLERGHERKQKAAFVKTLGAEGVVAIGNGANDAGMLRAAAIGIAVIGAEGASVETLQAADVVTTSILDALDLLLKPRRLIATLRR